jgi:hypothetical protein
MNRLLISCSRRGAPACCQGRGLMTPARSSSSALSSQSSPSKFKWKNHHLQVSSSLHFEMMRWTSSTTSGPVELERTVYVHPLSNICLEYLQNVRHDWVTLRGFEHLTLHRDGSFELKILKDKKDNCDGSGTTQTSAEISKARIWTSYDDQEKKHWLTVQTKDLHERYLLQDNLLSAWHDNRKTIHERIHEEIDDMIEAFENVHGKK